MSGMKPRFIDGKVRQKRYYETPDPYENAPSCHVNLLELSRYARRKGKKLVELTADEIKNLKYSYRIV